MNKNNRSIDLNGLPAEEAKLIAEIVDYLKFRATQQTRLVEKKGKGERIDETKTIRFKSWPLGAKGKLNRREIYDYL